MMELLLEQGTDVNAVDSAGRTALHLACQRSSCSNAVLLLISHKVRNPTFDLKTLAQSPDTVAD